MKTKAIAALLMTLALGVLGATTTTAQGKKEMAHDHMAMEMAKGPHHVLAMAYHHNLSTFAKALHEQAAGAGSVDVDFANAAVAEMRRSFDQMKKHHQAHMKTMSAEMNAAMGSMMQQMETHRTELDTQLTELEKETRSAKPDEKQVATLAASVHAHCDAMAKMHGGGQGSKMKMKM